MTLESTSDPWNRPLKGLGARVRASKGQFNLFKGQFNLFKGQFNLFKGQFNLFTGQFNLFKGQISKTTLESDPCEKKLTLEINLEQGLGDLLELAVIYTFRI